ncbi:uncharacterized protein PRCAT00001432001 [Priceomyces carsonii]|uniref:uncharacterized protein n=1 Tax=Priceomyces carsonii TaxID=28549 RepID=UPI002ED9DDA8|nr:unnamed protein product [Priceomyces carsonii]
MLLSTTLTRFIDDLEILSYKRGDKFRHVYGRIPERVVASLAAPCLFIVSFSVVTAYSIFQIIITSRLQRFRKAEKNVLWTMLPFIIGGLFEVIGYIGRATSHSNVTSLSPYIIQSVLLLVAPVLFAASIYMSLGRLIACLDCAEHSIIPIEYLYLVMLCLFLCNLMVAV